ncbi:MAG TPA: hypothetical protein VMU42_00245, partial [Candidatus Sulfotelmatobacter sp.]|nr:hypothetical protein [Candidatus Sulfotelmatobacter sp.]
MATGIIRPHLARYIRICAIFLGIQLVVVSLSAAAIEVINVARAYATGESFFSKGVKDAVIDL